MDGHSTNLRLWAVVGVCICVFQCSALADVYYSFGRTVNKSFGNPNEKVLLTADIFVPISGSILDIDLALNIKHASICDLWISIISPDGTYACINSYDEDNFVKNRVDLYWTVFDDESPISIDNAQSPHCGLYCPNGPDSLTDFYGLQSQGMWQVSVHDRRFADTGIFKGVRLDFHIDDTEPLGGLTSVSAVPEPATAMLFTISALIAVVQGRAKPV